MSANFDHHIKGPGGCQFSQWFWLFKVQIPKSIIPLTPTPSPAFVPQGGTSRRQAPGERGTSLFGRFGSSTEEILAEKILYVYMESTIWARN